MRLVMIPVMLWAASALAADQTCTKNTDCSAGLVCHMSCFTTGTGGGATPTPGKPDDANGCTGKCEAPEPIVSGVTCTADADCPYEFVCEEHEAPPCPTTDCVCMTPTPCAADTSCEPPAPCDCGDIKQPDCPTGKVKSCTFHPKVCTADGDCEADFKCWQDEVCSGSGGVGCACAAVACAPDTDCPPPPPCDCPDAGPPPEPTCTVMGAYCAPKQTECKTDAECPASWKCEDVPTGGDCACSGCACPPCAPDTTCSCQCPPCDCGKGESKSYCLPKGWDVIAKSGGMESGDGSFALPGSDKGGQNGQPTSADADAGTSKPPTAGGDTAVAASSQSSGGCATTPGGGSSLWALMLLALAVFGFRRRRA